MITRLPRLLIKAMPRIEEEPGYKEAQRDISGKWPEWHERPEWRAEAHALRHPETEEHEPTFHETATKLEDLKHQAADHIVKYHHHWGIVQWAHRARGPNPEDTPSEIHNHAKRAVFHYNEAKKLLDAGHIPQDEHFQHIARVHTYESRRARQADPERAWYHGMYHGGLSHIAHNRAYQGSAGRNEIPAQLPEQLRDVPAEKAMTIPDPQFEDVQPDGDSRLESMSKKTHKALSPEEEAHWKKQAEKDFPAKPSYQWWEMPGREHEKPGPEEPEEPEDLHAKAAHHIIHYNYQMEEGDRNRDRLNLHRYPPEHLRQRTIRHYERAKHHWQEAKKLLDQGAKPEAHHFAEVGSKYERYANRARPQFQSVSWKKYMFHGAVASEARIAAVEKQHWASTRHTTIPKDLPPRLENVEARKALSMKQNPFVCHGQIPPEAIQRIEHSPTEKAVSILKEMMSKAGGAPPSGDSYYPIPEGRRKREYDRSFKRDAPGIRGVHTPDLPDQGQDWPEGTDDEGLDRPPQNLVNPDEEETKAVKEILSRANSEAKKALAGAPRFSPGPFVSPPEKQYLKTRGYTDEEIEAGAATMSPRVRAEFNKWLTGTIRKSLTRLS